MSQHIIVRNYHFDFSAMTKSWLHDNPYLTHMFNASSICLPYIEGFVTFSVQYTSANIEDAKLRDDCNNFIKQESHHAREHLKFNKQLNFLGYEANSIILRLKNKLARIKSSWSVLSLLAVGVSFESLTAAISKTALQTQLLCDASSPIEDFWRWHMIEELEHKSVLFDLYKHLGGGYWRRIAIHTLVIAYCCYYSYRIYLKFLLTDGYSSWRGILEPLNRKSFFMQSLIKTFACYRPNFHPNAIYTDDLIKKNVLSLETKFPFGKSHGET